ncbi:hypothetical protein BJ912DRAFT_982302 [Pholiota molesta]|nr:hypothetical protein BJ912DRAFT_982302 [Pholiota molesta]
MATSRAESTLDIPLELVELIIDQAAAANDRDTLRTLALTSRHHVARCQKHLFHTIDLGDRCLPGREYYRRLHAVLAPRPALRAHVRELRLLDTYIWDRAKDWRWLVAEESLVDLLAGLPALQGFALTFNAAVPAWADFRAPIRNALVQLAQRPGLERFALTNITAFPASLLVALAAVPRLELCNVQVQAASAGAGAAPLAVALGIAAGAPPAVEELTLRTPAAGTLLALRTVLAVSAQPTLRTLRVLMVDHADTLVALELWGLLHWAAHSITALEWRPAVRPRTPATLPPAPINIGILTRLASLHFLVNFHSESAPVFAALLPLLLQISSGSHFHTLTVECTFIRPAELVACQRDWGALDAVLCGGAFDGLRRVDGGGGPAGELVRTVLGEQLPMVRGRGVRVVLDTSLR